MRSSLTEVGNVVGAWVAPALLVAAVAASLVMPARADDRTLPMRFELRLQGPTTQCGASCETLIVASGAITADSALDFKQFMKAMAMAGRDVRAATVVLDSDGGSVLGAIALGREIRKAKLATSVGRVTDLADKTDGAAGPTLARISPEADCESMCAFVVLGGIKRSVPAGARVMVHQIWLGDRREDPTAANYSAEDLVLVQRDIGRLAQFTAEMGASIDLLDLALRIPPWEPLHVMSRDEIARTRLATEEAPVPAAVAAGGATAPRPVAHPEQPATTGMQPMPIREHSWAMVQSDGGATSLARRHPLTVEGDQIGSFDLMLSCGTSGNFDLSYVERRRGSDSIALPSKLDGVSLRVGRDRIALNVVSSARRDQPNELSSLAIGQVPTSLIRTFAAGNRSVVVETTSGDVVTVIRIGNTGAPQNVPVLAAACSKALGNHAEATVVQKTGGMAAK